ncbi:MAG: hypothetical protein PHH01_02960 [Patescibacteria group bacterium]|nr:hypothetical protein [Patescibacteria group bacterium]
MNQQPLIEAVVESLDKSSATLQIFDQKINWPIDKLPAGVKAGDQICFYLSKTGPIEQEKLAKSILNEILKDEEA